MNKNHVDTWAPAGKLAFRLTFIYWVLYNFPFPISDIPYAWDLIGWYDDFWNRIVVWAGHAFFGKDITIRPAGSGDTTWNYVQIFCYLILSVSLSFLWSVMDRKRPNYSTLYRWLAIYLRFSLAAAMISYGAVKVIKAQFPDLTIDALAQPLGESSPMGLLWKFMGASWSFNAFTGGGEMLGGFLLTIRRTSLLGAMLCAVILSNVVMLNLSYDVPVKLYSMHLLAMALFLILPDWRRLANLFWLNRPVEPALFEPVFRSAAWNRAALVTRILLVAAFTAWSLVEAYTDRQSIHAPEARSPLHGLWNVEEFEIDGELAPLVFTETSRWRRVVFDRPDLLVIQRANDAWERYQLILDGEQKTLSLTKRSDPGWLARLGYERQTQDELFLEGEFGGRKVRAKLLRIDATQFPLVTRGFHWVNEYSNNH